MKKLIIALSLLSIAACTKKSSTSTSSSTSSGNSTFNITLNGHSYNLTSTTYPQIYAHTASGNGNQVYGNTAGNITAGYTVGIEVSGLSQMSCLFTGEKLDASTAIGTYHSGSYVIPSGSYGTFYGGLSLTDNGDGGKMYQNNNSIVNDTASTITVTISNANEVKGTFNIYLSCNGMAYLATGSFDSKH